MSLAYRTAVLSLGAQAVTGVATVFTLAFLPSDPDTRSALRLVASLELTSQWIEFAWYACVVCVLGRVETWARYADWVVTTPLMLASTALFLLHRAGAPLSDVWRLEGAACLACDEAMLLCGYAVETRRAPATAALALGSVFFIASFSFLGTYVDDDDALSRWLFWITYAVWACYGLAATLSDEPKNVAYNGLDLVSKNGYGLFLLAYGLSRR